MKKILIITAVLLTSCGRTHKQTLQNVRETFPKSTIICSLTTNTYFIVITGSDTLAVYTDNFLNGDVSDIVPAKKQ